MHKSYNRFFTFFSTFALAQRYNLKKNSDDLQRKNCTFKVISACTRKSRFQQSNYNKISILAWKNKNILLSETVNRFAEALYIWFLLSGSLSPANNINFSKN